jgi:hypothetical protein
LLMSQTGALSGAFDGEASFLIKGGATLMRICACGKGAAQIRIGDNSRITTLMCLNSRAVRKIRLISQQISYLRHPGDTG